MALSAPFLHHAVRKEQIAQNQPHCIKNNWLPCSSPCCTHSRKATSTKAAPFLLPVLKAHWTRTPKELHLLHQVSSHHICSHLKTEIADYSFNAPVSLSLISTILYCYQHYTDKNITGCKTQKTFKHERIIMYHPHTEGRGLDFSNYLIS